MYPLTRIGRLAAASVAALALAGCVTLQINSYLERGVDFGRFRTYAWGPADAFSTGDPRLDNNRFFRERVEAAVEHGLAPRRLEKTGAATADLLIHIHARVDQRLESDAFDRDDRRCDISECRSFVYDAGTLLLDFIDTRTHTLAWRGWAEGSLDGAIDDQDWMNARVDEAVAKILARLPQHARSTP